MLRHGQDHAREDVAASAAAHPREDIPSGTAYYAFSRMIMPRRWRSPRPQVDRGQFPE